MDILEQLSCPMATAINIPEKPQTLQNLAPAFCSNHNSLEMLITRNVNNVDDYGIPQSECDFQKKKNLKTHVKNSFNSLTKKPTWW